MTSSRSQHVGACALWFWLLGVDGGWESDVNFSVAGWSHSPHNLLIAPCGLTAHGTHVRAAQGSGLGR